MGSLSELPKNWRWEKLGKYIGSCRNGYGRRPRGLEDGPIVLRLADVAKGNIDLSDVRRVAMSNKEFETYKLRQGDILFTRVNGSREQVGQCILVDNDYNNLAFNDHLIRIRLKEGLLGKYLQAVMLSASARARLLTFIPPTEGGQLTVNQKSLNSLRIPLPPLPEQRKIAEILGTWDKAIALTEQLIAAKQQRKKALMQQLLTGQRRFMEFEGEPWREVRLGDVFKERKETGFESLPLLAITAEEGIVYRDTLNRRDTSTPDKSKYLRICPGDVGYNTMRMWQGRSGVSELEGIVSPAYTICTPKPSVDVYFMGYLFKLPSTIHLFRRYSQGLVSDTWNLKFNAFAAIKVKIPKLEEQKKIAAVLKACDTEIDLLTQKLDALERQKKGLMQQLLTGRTRVKV